MTGFATLLAQCSNVVECGRGGQKTVYKANHHTFGVVAIKRGKYNSDASLERITREVELLKSLDSEYFAKNYEFLVDPTEREFLILEEFLDAEPLSVASARFEREVAIVNLLRSIILGMQPVWDQRIVHRDLKPDNIMITEDLRPKIVDFGIARFLDFTSLTKTMALMGPATPMYAAPEQLLNRKIDIDVRTDFFALGIIAAELHMGFHPFDPTHVGNQQSIPENIVHGNYVVPSEDTGASPNFIQLARRSLQTEPYRRFRNPRMLLDYINEHWRPTT